LRIWWEFFWRGIDGNALCHSVCIQRVGKRLKLPLCQDAFLPPSPEPREVVVKSHVNENSRMTPGKSGSSMEETRAKASDYMRKK